MNEPHPPGSDDKKPRARREVRLIVRLTKDEDAAIGRAAAAAGATKSEYVRARALHHPPRHNAPATGERRDLLEILGQLGKIGSNMNQIAYHLNSGFEPEAQALHFALADIAAIGTLLRNHLLYGDNRQDTAER